MEAQRKRVPKPYVETHEITADDITAKGFDLQFLPKWKELTRYEPTTGLLQEFGIDYTIDGKKLTWDGLGLSSFEFKVGDRIVVSYFY